MRLDKITGIIICFTSLLFITGCGKNYTGQYINIATEVQMVCKNDRGEIFNPTESLFGMSMKPEGFHRYYVYNFVKNILNIKQDKSSIDGSFIITDDEQLMEFDIKTGYIDEQKKLHLKMIWKPDANIGFSFFGISASGSLGEMLLNFDEIGCSEKKKVKIWFKVTGAANFLSGLFGRGVPGEWTITFDKYKDTETEQYVGNFKKLLIETDKEKLWKLNLTVQLK